MDLRSSETGITTVRIHHNFALSSPICEFLSSVEVNNGDFQSTLWVFANHNIIRVQISMTYRYLRRMEKLDPFKELTHNLLASNFRESSRNRFFLDLTGIIHEGLAFDMLHNYVYSFFSLVYEGLFYSHNPRMG